MYFIYERNDRYLSRKIFMIDEQPFALEQVTEILSSNSHLIINNFVTKTKMRTRCLDGTVRGRVFNRSENSRYSRRGLSIPEHLQTLKAARRGAAKTFRRAETRTNEHFASSDGVSKAIRASSCAFSTASGHQHGENFARMFPNMSRDREQRTKLTELRRAEWKFLKRAYPLSRTPVSWCNFVPVPSLWKGLGELCFLS